MSCHTSTDVLIVGAGPTGTTLAIDLARRGVSVRLIDKQPNAFDGSRAKGVQPRTLEIFEDLGVLDDILDRGAPYPKMGIHLGPVTVPHRMMAVGRVGPDVPYPDAWLISQQSTVSVLHRAFESHGAHVELGSELESFRATPDGVTAQIVTGTRPEQISAQYLVGADGGSSRVRKGAGIDFAGSTDDADRMLIVDAPVEGNALSRRYWHVWPGLRGRFVGACPLPYSDNFQWMIRLSPDEEPPADLDAINRRIREHTRNRKLVLSDVAWRSVFRPNIRLAERYRAGRVLIAGDAAHVHTPAGAQGMNTGVGDAYNLGWKLAQVLAGADETLIDTYESERRPVAAAVLRLSTEKYEGMGRLDPSSIKRGDDEKQLTLTYRGGPLARGDDTRAVQTGDRAPDARLRTSDGTEIRLFEVMRGHHFTAIAFGRRAADRLAGLEWPSRGAPLVRVAIGDRDDTAAALHRLSDPDGQFARTYGLDGDTLLIVRPDGHVGHIGTADASTTDATVIAGFVER